MINVTNNNFWLLDQLEENSEKEFILMREEKISFKLFYENSCRLAEYLKSNGIKKNDHITLLLEQPKDFFITIQALWFLGAIPIPINSRLKKTEIDNQLKISDSRFIISDKENSQSYSGIIQIKFDAKEYGNYFCKHTEYDYNPASIALMLFTSGSTGNPKCVKLSFNNLFASAKSADEYINHFYNDVWLASLPFYHIGGFSIFTRAIIFGCKIAIPESLKSDKLFECINNFHPTLLSFVPTMLAKMIEHFPNSWKALRIAFIGGAPAEENFIVNAINNGWQISTVYGSTETASMVTVASPENIIANGLSAGRPFNGVEINFSNQKIIVKSKSVAEGYYNLKDESEHQIERGKFFSNDIGKIDKFGNLKILGRCDDIIISGGENISLTEIENILNKNSELKLCSAIGIKDKKWGQSYIVVSDSKIADLEKEISKILKNEIGKFKLPSKIIRIDEIPTSSLGKVRKNEIRKKLNLEFL